ncbi:hypothetical protein PIROE2DRAFT_10492 [Piromyces sp. E2]|nr:hypothetical protein PIROE2DRAFT_10492 [Piromyces sp. E2]|eukprot:OUM63076.1 hypothetical protein PIROE2DRAFT_10492 [Piromyces sp. E2]
MASTYTITDLKRIVIKDINLKILCTAPHAIAEHIIDYCTYNQEKNKMKVDPYQLFKKNDKIVKIELLASFHDNIAREYVTKPITYIASFTGLTPGYRDAPFSYTKNNQKIKAKVFA